MGRVTDHTHNLGAEVDSDIDIQVLTESVLARKVLERKLAVDDSHTPDL